MIYSVIVGTNMISSDNDKVSAAGALFANSPQQYRAELLSVHFEPPASTPACLLAGGSVVPARHMPHTFASDWTSDFLLFLTA